MPSLISMNQLNVTALSPAAELLPHDWDSLNARRFLLAWFWQETKLATMRQYGNGPAAGFGQFEKPTIELILHNRNQQFAAFAKSACEACGVPANTQAIWDHFQTARGQILMAVFARLDLRCDSKPIPTTEDDGWDCYANRVVRPGKPRRKDWTESWALASAALGLTP